MKQIIKEIMNTREKKKSKSEKVKSEILYEKIDKNLVKLVETLNCFDEVYTIGSCGGHKNNKPFQLPFGEWNVIFKVNPSKKGFIALEFLVWAVNNNLARSNHKVFICPHAPPPFLNGLGESLYFTFEGKDVSPDKIAKELDDLALQYYGQTVCDLD